MLANFEIKKVTNDPKNPIFQVTDSRGHIKFQSSSVRLCCQWIRNYNTNLYSK